MGWQKLSKKLKRVVTNRNKKRAPKYSQKRKEIGTDQRGWKWGTKTEHRNGCQKETSKVMKKKRE